MGHTVVLHPGALGDVLLAIPALRALRARALDDGLVLAAQPRIGTLLAALGVVDRPLDFDTLGLDTLFAADAAPERLRLADMGGLATGPPNPPDARDAPAKPWRPSKNSDRLLAGARVVSWFGSKDPHFSHRLRALAADAVVCSTIPAERLTVWRHLLASVATLSAGAASEEAWREPIAVRRELIDAGRRALVDAGWDGARPLVMLHPGAGGVAKRWPVEGFAEVAEMVADAIGAGVVVHEGPADRDAAVALRDRLRVPAYALVDPPLETLAGAMHHAALWIGNDSGVSHLAAAVGAPTLALFTAANLAWRPWAPGARVRVVSVDALAPSDVDAVVADATGLLRWRGERAVGARGDR